MKLKIISTILFIAFLQITIFSLSLGTGLGNHTVVSTAGGTVYTWGYNSTGQLGNGTNTNSNVPVAVNTAGVLSGKTITEVACSYGHSIVLASDGTVYTWGANSVGELGNGYNTDSNLPVAVSTAGVLSGKTITEVACGYGHSMALASDGTVFTWGYNSYGQLGNGNNTDSNVPVAVTGLSGKTITAVACGYYHSIALAADGIVYTWGYNSYGQLGNGNTGTNSNVPVVVPGLYGKTIIAVTCGYNNSIALALNGTVYDWGRNSYGQLGNGYNTDSNLPVAVSTAGVLSGKTITEVACGYGHSIALASDGTVYTWGFNSTGQLGNGTNTNSNVPVAVNTTGVLSGKTILKVACGLYHSIVMASDGTVFTWGFNSYGQLGNGNNTDSNVPVGASISPLPVELSNFSVFVNEDIVNLNWQTATEVNNHGFEVQRSVVSGQQSAVNDWQKVGFVEGAGNSNSTKSYSYKDKPTGSMSFSYRLKQIDNDGKFKYLDAVTVTLDVPTATALIGNYPNPFNPATTIKFSIAKSGNVKLIIYNTVGSKVATIVNEYKPAGNYSVQFNGSNLASGIYLYRLESGNYCAVKKFVLMK